MTLPTVSVQAEILLLDNYDSFTYNLVHRLHEVGAEKITVLRNDRCSLADIASFSHVVLSPGPGIPSEAGMMMEILEAVKGKLPVLGVCLGHQAIAESFGARLVNISPVVHGKKHEITVDPSSTLFAGLPEKISVGRYHSWVVEPQSLPEELVVTATGPKGEIMALEHRELPIAGVQFHPESIMTEMGHDILRNWLAR
ncbi:aminodeoxychorismate/anthranilate synthase component II [bacterium]|nr:aminodeoxychorismate/anthranilate synthase component II [bacterium]